MPWFQCLIRGENFILKDDIELKNFGFYTTRYVEAEDAVAAEKKVLEILKADEFLSDMPEDQKNPNARVYFEKIEELPYRREGAADSGFTWFLMEKPETDPVG
ncbi:hypothetical protein [Hyphococcus sp.]|uniref:hypothetical protein n=1 Tax=Hyphococcus sp. TaxID=2038636 RepID=UPI003CCC3EF1